LSSLGAVDLATRWRAWPPPPEIQLPSSDMPALLCNVSLLPVRWRRRTTANS
jgi:hypothetical protein